MGRPAYDKILEAQHLGRYYQRKWQKTSIINTATLGNYHLFQNAGDPAAGTYAGAALAAQQYVGGTAPTVAGGYLTYPNPVAPRQNYITKAKGLNKTASAIGVFHFVDLLVAYQGFNGNSAIAQPTTGSAVNVDILPRYVGGLNCVLWADVQTALGATPANLTVSYSKDTSSGARTTISTAIVVSSGQSRIPHVPLFLPLQAGDRNIISIQSATLSAGTGAGTFALCIGHYLGSLVLATTGVEADQNFLSPPDTEEVETDAAVTLLHEVTTGTTTPTWGGWLSLTEYNPSAA
jgi:hypothetical protein